jgi:hypothetical protein
LTTATAGSDAADTSNKKLEARMRLFAEGPEIHVEARLGTAERLEDADGFACVRRFRTRTVGPGERAVAHEGRDSDIAGTKAAQENDRTLGERQRCQVHAGHLFLAALKLDLLNELPGCVPKSVRLAARGVGRFAHECFPRQGREEFHV